jgi:hypothetical protein
MGAQNTTYPLDKQSNFFYIYNMKKLPIFLTIYIVLSILFLVNCSDESKAQELLDEIAPLENIFSSSSTNWCVYRSGRWCFEGQFEECLGGAGILTGACPYGSSSSSVSELPVKFDYDKTTNKAMFIDQRDNAKYKYEIDFLGKVWMGENLNYSKKSISGKGTVGYCYKTETLGEPGEEGNGCNSPYGRAYNWEAAMDWNVFQGLCPDGWHIPSETEWQGISVPQTTSLLSYDFYLKAGRYDDGWKDYSLSGFYWANDAANDTASYVLIKDNYVIEVSNKKASTYKDYFYIRCKMDDNFTPMCGGVQFNLATEFCVNNEKFSKCNGGTKMYNPDIEECDPIDDKVYEKCGTVLIKDPSKFCFKDETGNGEERDRCGGKTYLHTQKCVNTNGKYTVQNIKACPTYNPTIEFCDTRDGSVYKKVDIGGKTWMAENLNFTDADGDIGMCYGQGKAFTPEQVQSNCNQYGRLYIWDDAKSYCPPDWELPKRLDWEAVGSSIKSEGFSPLYGGYLSANSYYDIEDQGYWWTATQPIANNNYDRVALSKYGPNATYSNVSKNAFYYSVRCIKSSP